MRLVESRTHVCEWFTVFFVFRRFLLGVFELSQFDDVRALLGRSIMGNENKEKFNVLPLKLQQAFILRNR